MKQKITSRLLSLITTIGVVATTFGGSTSVMAAEVSNNFTDDTSTVESMYYAEEAEMLRGKIDDLIAETNQAKASYKTDYWGAVTVSGSHTGAWHSIYGNKARMCIAFKPTDGNSALSVNLSTSFWGWTVHYNPSNTDSDGYYMYVGDWRDINYASAYRMTYQLFTTGGSFSTERGERTGSFHVWVDYQ